MATLDKLYVGQKTIQKYHPNWKVNQVILNGYKKMDDYIQRLQVPPIPSPLPLPLTKPFPAPLPGTPPNIEQSRRYIRQKARMTSVQRIANMQFQDRDQAWIQQQITIIETYWSHEHEDTVSFADANDNEIEYFQNQEFQYVEDLYIITIAQLNSCLTTKKVSQQACATQQLRLPNTELPKVNGNLNNWTPFYDLFKGMVHENDALTEIQKMHYLKNSIIKHLEISEINYETAWNMIISRYDNKRLLISTQIGILMNQQNLLAELLKNQISIEESTLNVFKRNREDNNNHLQKIEDYIKSYTNKTNRNTFYELFQVELNNCQRVDESFLCHQKSPLILTTQLPAKNCEINIIKLIENSLSNCAVRIMTASPIWIKLVSPNNWIYVLDKMYRMNTICSNQPSSFSLDGERMMKIQKNCIIKTDHIIIKGEKSFVTSDDPDIKFSS